MQICAFQVAHAAKLPDFKQTGANVTSNSAKIGMTGNGVEWGSTIPISPVVGGWTYAGNYGIPQAAKGTTMNMSASGDVFIAGTKYPFQAGYTVPASNVWSGLVSAASIVGGMAGGPVGLSILVASTAAPYIKEWFEDSGMRVKPDGSNTIQRGDPYYCGVAPCYEYNGNTYSLQWRANPQTACVQWVNLYSNLYTYVDTQNAGGGDYTCVRKDKGTNVVSGFQLGKRARAVDAIKQWFDMPSMSDISPYMQANPFDPRVVPEILAQGGDIPMPAPTVTGPTHGTQPAGRFSTLGAHIPPEKTRMIERGIEFLLRKLRCFGPHATRWAEATIEVRGIPGAHHPRVAEPGTEISGRGDRAGLRHGVAQPGVSLPRDPAIVGTPGRRATADPGVPGRASDHSIGVGVR